MNTRTEQIGSVTYCAYCGAPLQDNNCGYSIYPQPPLICTCEKAQEELDVFEKLKALHRIPIAESLIDMKVQCYKEALLKARNFTFSASDTGTASNLAAPTGRELK